MLDGQLVRLRAIEPGDRERAHAWLDDPEVTYYLTMRYPLASADPMWLADAQPASFANGVYLAVETKDGTHIGAINLHELNPEDRKAGLGIIIGDKACWSNGYGLDAIATLLRFAFHEMNLHRVWLSVLAGHEAAIRCYEKCGFRHESRRRQQVFKHGRYWDVLIMSILRDEFDAPHVAPSPERGT
ncbi:MAG: GNAT family protein [Dehalococcoidia bacterium]